MPVQDVNEGMEVYYREYKPLVVRKEQEAISLLVETGRI